MSNGQKKRMKELRTVISQIPGFKILSIEPTKNDHLCCHVRDDAGNCFKCYTGTTCSANTKRARLNFRQDIRRQSNRAKGLVD